MNNKLKGKKTVKINKNNQVTFFGGKKNYIFNIFCKSYLDSNNAGDVFYLEKERIVFQKWEFLKSSNSGSYYLKNCQTGLFLSSDPSGEIFSTVSNETSYQMWNIYSASEKDLYVVTNKGNEFVLDCSIRNTLYLNMMDECNLEDAKKNILFKIYQILPKKR
jgi:hypothetical protein